MAVKWVYEVGPLTLNFRVLLEPKGFLRILMVIIAILAFSITAGFTDGPNDNSVDCTSDNFSRTAVLEFSYPFQAQNFKARYASNGNDAVIIRNGTCARDEGFDDRSFAGFAQFFVAIGVMTFLYCLGMLFVYVMFINPKLSFAKWIIVFDFIASILFAFLYLLADILWSAGIAGLETYVDSELIRRATDCLRCGTYEVDSGVYAQPAISVVFGWLLCFIWFCSLWYTYKDTFWHKDRAGPLYTPKEEPAKPTEGASVGPPAPAAPEAVTGTY